MKKFTTQKEKRKVASVKSSPDERKNRAVHGKQSAKPGLGARHPGGKPAALLTERAPGTKVQLIVIEYLNDAAGVVFLAGTFNDWNPCADPLAKHSGGTWSRRLLLEPGEYEYRFIVDGLWQDDPTVSCRVANPFGGFNSVLVVEVR